MSTYNQILDEVKSLSLTDQRRLLEELKKIVDRGVEVESKDEVIPAEEIAQSDRGISSKELKSKLYALEIQGETIVLRPATLQIVSEKQQTPEIAVDPLIGLFAVSPALATKSEEILQQEITEKSGWTWKPTNDYNQ
ncbi:hypothetical protein [Microseira sp. BLCC-F43]|jgi:sugar-specific transcriptional regulator TrmB|uniref:hypothetical protein n=1 Tax=Microseira sp. BLCC-F43 TaxID=3153602 RepID=UPI0035BB7402